MKKLLTLVLALGFMFGASAQKTISLEGADETVRLWDNSTAKYSNHQTKDEAWRKGKKNSMINTSSCELYIFKANPAKNTGIAICYYPGGGFTSLNFSISTAKWYASQGITAVLVKYRLPNGYKDAMLEDAFGAVRYIRTRTDLGVDPNKVGVTGSSAGGCLTALVSNLMPDEEKPAFAIPLYGSMVRTEFYAGNKANYALLGKDFTWQDAVDMSSQNMVTPNTPPTLLFLCDDDKVVLPYSSVVYYEALLRHGVKASMHIFPEGGHSLKKATKEQRTLIIDWLKWLGLYNAK
ncbi:MAG: alpha/beta hydrolase [Alistipes sp.]|nr:alpha/beta hydrolase [Alistipes sp.]